MDLHPRISKKAKGGNQLTASIPVSQVASCLIFVNREEKYYESIW